MVERRLRTLLGLSLVTSHVLVLVFCISVYFTGAILFEQMTQVIAIVAPIFALGTAAVIQYFIRDKVVTPDTGRHVRAEYSFVAFLFPTLYTISVLGLVATFGYTRALSFNQLVTLLGVVEASFAVYSGKIIRDLYPGELNQRTKRVTA
jgi:hypothetical protein